ncbi:hypothetical protein RFI_05615 [Reticulomyxa filosa]|uniref:Kelch motif family protein n=1 Tax=Reticulomyxa filosa TaxID=46433 RepID=X6P0A4_RETFI|nr:hypothetical protein RFI_05615 [Reticulomyxa filosa]|eukprot:ETO31504.1 hypothetical protein RFI_05615 [Reticulomyxa filosa]
MFNQNKTLFQSLKDLPIPLCHTQCILYKHELLICGGYEQRVCYSYHTIKNEYKFICEYPIDAALQVHCVVKLVDNNKDNDQITLLSFGSTNDGENKHTLIMKYVSVWNELNDCNQWIPFTDNHNNPIILGGNSDYRGVRAVIGGRNKNLLFIAYYYYNISVFNLNTFQFIRYDILPIDKSISFYCFVLKPEDEKEQEMMKINRQNCQMLLFKQSKGLSIEYDEDNNTFQYHQLSICDDIIPFYAYAYVCIDDIILFFGGYYWSGNTCIISKLVHKYSIRENKWMVFENTLPISLSDSVAILNEEDNDIHIIGGQDNKYTAVLTHMKTKLSIWDPLQLVIIYLFIYFNEIKINLTNN